MEARRKRRPFTEDFKKQIVDLRNAGKSVSEICRGYDLGHSTVERWVARINKTGSTREKDNRTPEQQKIIEQEKELKRLRQGAKIF